MVVGTGHTIVNYRVAGAGDVNYVELL